MLRETGARVAVKVQHEGLRETSNADIATVAALVRIIKALFPAFDYEWLADEIRVNLPQELDFVNEAGNCEAAGRAFARRPDVAVPTIYRRWTTHRVLTMSFEDGVYADNVAGIRGMGLQPADVARLVSEVFSEQIYSHGVAHCDPHAANMLIRPMPAGGGGGAAVGGGGVAAWLLPWRWSVWRGVVNPAPRPQLVILDHGLYRRIPEQLRLDYCKVRHGRRSVQASMSMTPTVCVCVCVCVCGMGRSADSTTAMRGLGGVVVGAARRSQRVRDSHHRVIVTWRRLSPVACPPSPTRRAVVALHSPRRRGGHQAVLRAHGCGRHVPAVGVDADDAVVG